MPSDKIKPIGLLDLKRAIMEHESDLADSFAPTAATTPGACRACFCLVIVPDHPIPPSRLYHHCWWGEDEVDLRQSAFCPPRLGSQMCCSP
jgi:hypothetical protein